MEKLKIEQILPYLPYGLQLNVKRKFDQSFCIGRMCEITHKSNHGDWIKVWFDDEIETTNHAYEVYKSNMHYFFFGEDEIKPILLPLSEFFNQEYINVFETGMTYSYWLEDKLGIRFEINDNGTFQFYVEDDSLSVLGTMNALRFLYSNHFDVCGLIEKGLAIDKTTLK